MGAWRESALSSRIKLSVDFWRYYYADKRYDDIQSYNVWCQRKIKIEFKIAPLYSE